MKHTWSLLLVLSSLFSEKGRSQERNFEQTKAFIVEKVRCCAVPFTPSRPDKVAGITIGKDGTITLNYDPDKAPQTFNLFELYKLNDTATGIELNKDSKFVQFHVSGLRTRLISFATHQEAKEVYTAFLDLLQLCEQEKPAFSDLNFNQTVDVINIRLEKWSRGFKQVISALPNGNMILVRGGNPDFRFNLLDLKDPYYHEGNVRYGIEAVNCTYGTKAPSSRINFYNASGQVGFLKLDCAPDAEVKILHQAFLHLRSLCKQ